MVYPEPGHLADRGPGLPDQVGGAVGPAHAARAGGAAVRGRRQDDQGRHETVSLARYVG